jgi:hypothetical protein
MLFGAFVLSSWWAVQHGPDQQLSASTRWVVFTTVFAAILGLFRDGLVRWIWFPELDMEFKNGRPYCDNPPETVNEGRFRTIWFRPLVINKGTARAEKVEVMVADVIRHPDDAPATYDRQFFLNLAWSNSSGAPRQGSAVLVWDGLNPGTRRFVDLAKIYEPSERKLLCGSRENLPGEDGAIFSVAVEYLNTNCWHLLHAGKWQLTLLLSAANHKTLYYRADVHLTGVWHDSMDAMLDPETPDVEVRITPLKRTHLGPKVPL